jgi:cytochrome c peroxidase
MRKRKRFTSLGKKCFFTTLTTVTALLFGLTIPRRTASAQSTPPPLDICSKSVNIASLLPGGANEDPDVAAANALIDSQFAAAQFQIQTNPPAGAALQEQLLGKIEIFDKSLSVNGNLACASCHDPAAGFTGASSYLNQTIVAQPGSVHVTNATNGAPNYRISSRKPQAYPYMALAPILHYNATQQDFYGGNFWDLRATGQRLGNPAAEQAQGPPLNPLEMGWPDSACLVYKLSQSSYATFFEKVWGTQSFSIAWPSNAQQVCSTPGPAPANNPYPVQLTEADRATSNSAFDHFALAIAQEESSEESSFSSKFDAYLAGLTGLTAQEMNGYKLFNGKAGCNQCHLSGNATSSGHPGTAADVAPLFTDFTANNIGVPKNLALPWYCESTPDQYGYTANPAGINSTDDGLGSILATSTNPAWQALAPNFMGKFQTATVRNADMRPYPTFVKAYMHNGYLKSLKEVVHFYNTSQALPHCQQGSPGEKVTCWPTPEVQQNLNTTQLGNLHLNSNEEDDIVAFLQTLTDGWFNPSTGLISGAGADPESTTNQ